MQSSGGGGQRKGRSGGRRGDDRAERGERGVAAGDGAGQDEAETGIFLHRATGAVYKGETVVNSAGMPVRHGKGEWIDGEAKYEGEFRNDVMHGKGSYTYPSGASYSGDWADGKYSGHGTYQWPDGSFYQGSFVANAIHGEGKFVDAAGREWSGSYYNNVGPGLVHDEYE